MTHVDVVSLIRNVRPTVYCSVQQTIRIFPEPDYPSAARLETECVIHDGQLGSFTGKSHSECLQKYYEHAVALAGSTDPKVAAAMREVVAHLDVYRSVVPTFGKGVTA